MFESKSGQAEFASRSNAGRATPPVLFEAVPVTHGTVLLPETRVAARPARGGSADTDVNAQRYCMADWY